MKKYILLALILLSSCVNAGKPLTESEISQLRELLAHPVNQNVIQGGLTVVGDIDVYGKGLIHDTLSASNIYASDSIKADNEINATGIIRANDKMYSPAYIVSP